MSKKCCTFVTEYVRKSQLTKNINYNLINMKKILTIITALTLFGSLMVVHATDYYVAGTMNGWNAGDSNYKMTGSGPYSVTKQLSSGDYEFKITNGSWGWSSATYDNDASNVALSTNNGNIKFTLSTTSDVTFYYSTSSNKAYVQATAVVVPSYTFTSGTTIYYDFTAYGSGVNLFNSLWNNEWKSDVSSIISCTLTSNWEVTASSSLFKSAASSWNIVTCSTLPTEGQNMLVSTDGATYHWDTYSGGAPEPEPATIQLHSNITNPSWESSANFTLAVNEETASLTLTGVTKGSYEFGVKIDGTWTSNGSAFTRANNSHAIASGSGNCTFNADRNGDYTFTWTYATNTLAVTYPDIPSQSVAFTSLASEILKSSVINLANCVTSSGIDNPTYRFYIKEKNGSYGDAINANYNFNTNGEYVVKVEALEDGDGEPVASDESAVVVYQSYTFTNGYTLYVDFSAMTEGSKGVNYPKANEVGMDYDATGAGTIKAVTFTSNVTWTTMAESFIKTEKNSWAAQPFTVPGTGKNCIKVAADGASYTWDTYVDLNTNFYLAGSFNGWETAEDRFIKTTEDATVASVTINITEYSNITFKVIDNGAWRGCDPVKTITKDDRSVTILSDAEGNNVAMTPYAAGDYVFTLNLSTRELTVTYPDGDQMPIPTNIYLSSEELNNWAEADPDYKFSVSGDLATLEVDLDAETNYGFKLVYNSAWLGADYNFNYYWCTDVPMVVDGVQANVYSFKEGTYTFRYTLSTGELSIAFPTTSATNISISEYEYATLYSATGFDVPNEVEAYIITGLDGIKLSMERIYRIPAETGVLLHAPQGTYPFYEGDSRYMGVDVSDNLLKGSLTDQTINNELVHFVLSYDASYNVGLFWPYGTGAAQGVGSFENKAGKAYLEIPAESQSAGVAARRGFPFRPTPQVVTALSEIENETGAQKFIYEGQLFIIRDGMLFNAQGARVQ